jgi:hypothetical protein
MRARSPGGRASSTAVDSRGREPSIEVERDLVNLRLLDIGARLCCWLSSGEPMIYARAAGTVLAFGATVGVK